MVSCVEGAPPLCVSQGMLGHTIVSKADVWETDESQIVDSCLAENIFGPMSSTALQSLQGGHWADQSLIVLVEDIVGARVQAVMKLLETVIVSLSVVVWDWL